MTTTLRTVAIDVVGQYNAAGKHLLNAWRTGAGRVIGGASTRYADAVGTSQFPFVSEDVKARLLGAQEKVAGFLATRLESDTAFTEKLMDTVAERTAGGIQYVADASQRVNSEIGTSVLNTLQAVHLPFAQISLKVAEKVAEGAGKIEARVAGDKAESAEATTVRAKPARRAARGTRRA
ncbi:MAG: hypothetical protein DI563_24985 [Variovorax paradoxus]|uniref:Uncharacterized protein n=1 Tax=Variovorax paradoxus TaxID=34073 RepID=A0A2W5PLT8_VARPD|nr:MAG: hypothetical protein DI563_24985 [Variovorax paradoxus]